MSVCEWLRSLLRVRKSAPRGHYSAASSARPTYQSYWRENRKSLGGMSPLRKAHATQTLDGLEDAEARALVAKALLLLIADTEITRNAKKKAWRVQRATEPLLGRRVEP